MKPVPILVKLTVEWKKSDTKYSPHGISGGYDYHGSPNILYQGGYHSPDFTMTLQEIKKRCIESLDYTNRPVKFKITITQDDRNPTMDSFF